MNLGLISDSYLGIQYYYKGSGHCLVFIHGYCDCALIWQPIIERLPHETAVLVLDLPGHGASTVPANQNGEFEEFAQLMHDILNRCGFTTFSLVGHSMGGYVAMAFTKLFEQRVTHLLLVHSHPFTDSPKKIKQRLREIDLINRGKFSLILQMAQQNIANSNISLHYSSLITSHNTTQEGALWAINAMLKRADYSNWFLNTVVPYTFCLSPQDEKISFDMMNNWLKNVHGELVVFNQSKHLCFWEETERFMITIKRFCNL